MHWKQRACLQCFSAQLLNWKYICLRWQFHRSIGRKKIGEKKIARMMRNIYALVDLAIRNANEVVAYKALDLLKLAFGEKMIRPDEAGKIMSLCVVSLKEKQYSITNYILDAYKPLIKNAESFSLGEIVKELNMVVHVAKRLHQEYLLSKVANYIFEGVRSISGESETDAAIAIDAMRAVGLNAAKMKDAALFREVNGCLLNFEFCEGSKVNRRMSLLLSVWMHQIMKQDDKCLLAIFAETCRRFLDRPYFSAEIVSELIRDSDNLVCAIAANTRLKCTVNFIEFLLDLSSKSVEDRRTAANIIVRIARLTAELHGIRQGFQTAAPLLEKGRSLLGEELKFTKSDNAFRRKNLSIIIGELILLSDLIARKDGEMSNMEVMMRINDCWLEYYQKEINRLSVNQFCQLVMRQMVKGRTVRKNSRRALPIFINRSLITDVQMKKIGMG